MEKARQCTTETFAVQVGSNSGKYKDNVEDDQTYVGTDNDPSFCLIALGPVRRKR